MALQDDKSIGHRGTDNYKLSYGGLKTKLTEDGFGGGGGGGDPVVTVEPTLTAAGNYPPTTDSYQAQVSMVPRVSF